LCQSNDRKTLRRVAAFFQGRRRTTAIMEQARHTQSPAAKYRRKWLWCGAAFRNQPNDQRGEERRLRRAAVYRLCARTNHTLRARGGAEGPNLHALRWQAEGISRFCTGTVCKSGG